MLAKLRLNQTDMYEKLVGANVVSKMLVSFVEGKVHPTAIGAEQGGIEHWDDFVIQETKKSKKHIQIKRQTGNFCSDNDKCERNTIKRQSGNTELRDLSELDKAIKSLGIWVKTKKDIDDFKRSFLIVVYEGGAEIKKDFKIRDLVNILQTHFRSDTSTPEGIKSLCESDSNMKNCESWLRTWCDIKDFNQIVELFKVLSIEYGNTESKLASETKDILRRVFIDSKVDEVHSTILEYIFENSTYTGAIIPRRLLCTLKDNLRKDIKGWTKFQFNDLKWNVSGTLDLENCSDFERPSAIVPAMWNKDNSRLLKIDGECLDDCHVSKVLMQISLHPQGPFDVFCTDKSSWMNSIKTKTGGTLGISNNDLDDLRLLDELETCTQSEQKVLSNISEQCAFANEMQEKMYLITLESVNKKLVDKFRKMKSHNLCSLVEKRWSEWNKILNGDIEKIKKLFNNILYPQAEGESILGEVRVGPRTVELIKEAIFFLLVTSVCLSDSEDSTWESVKNTLHLSAIGLAFWSGPASGKKEVIEIDDEIGIGQLLENEAGQIVILNQSKNFSSQIYNDSIFGNITNNVLLAQPKYPKILITNDRDFKRKIDQGDVDELREFLQSKLDKYNDSIKDAVNEVAN